MNFRKRFSFSLIEVMLVIAIVGLLAAFALPASAADQQGYPTTLNTATNIPATVAASSISNGIASYIPIQQGKGLALAWIFDASAGNSSAGLYLAPTVDGTNFDTTSWVLTRAANAATNTVATTNWYRGQLDGYIGLLVVGITNYHASATLTNKALLFSYPN